MSSSEVINPPSLHNVPVPVPPLLPAPDLLPPTRATGSGLTSFLPLPVLGLLPPRTALPPPNRHSSLIHCQTPPTAHPPCRYLVGTPTSATVSQHEVPIRRPGWPIRSVSAHRHPTAITPARPRSTAAEGT